VKNKIKEYWEIIKNNLFLVIGVGLFVYACSLFIFRSNEICDTFGLLLSIKIGCYNPSVPTTLLVLGAIFITIGLLKLRKNR